MKLDKLYLSFQLHQQKHSEMIVMTEGVRLFHSYHVMNYFLLHQ